MAIRFLFFVPPSLSNDFPRLWSGLVPSPMRRVWHSLIIVPKLSRLLSVSPSLLPLATAIKTHSSSFSYTTPREFIQLVQYTTRRYKLWGLKCSPSLAFSFSLSLFTINSAHSAVTHHHHRPLCHENERSALLQFKQGFSIARINGPIPELNYASVPFHPKTLSWNSTHGEEGGDCCRWDGVECDDNTGHVIGLDLGASGLYGSIDSSSSLFQLLHLQRLKLSFNNFNHSPIPPEIGRLSGLTFLSLYYSSFSGKIPSQIFALSNLVSLFLGGNPLSILPPNPGLAGLVQNLTSLQLLFLNKVNISSPVPDSMANLTSLVTLSLGQCSLNGQFPPGIFSLPNLQILDLHDNSNLAGFLRGFKRGSPLTKLRLARTGFSGEISNLANLNSLIIVEIESCRFWGSIPESLSNLTQLTQLSLFGNSFNRGSFPPWIGKLSKLQALGLDDTNLEGEIPSSLANLTNVSVLSFGSNQLMGLIPSWLVNLTCIQDLVLGRNELQGPIPNSIFEMGRLQVLDLRGNRFSGTVEFDKFINLRDLGCLDLSDNKLSVHTNPNIFNATFPNFRILGLASCNLSAFPDFLHGQNELQWLDLYGNNIGGLIPKWFWNMSSKSLLSLDVGNNSLIGFQQLPVYLPWEKLQVLVLKSNKLQGPLPIPSSTLVVYQVSQNSFSGNLSPMLCNLDSLQVLDVSENDLGGTIPDSFKSNSQLRQINLRHNQLHGHLPRSLENCEVLEILDVSNNHINDTFPSWLGVLPKLHIMVLQSNEFHGVVGNFDVGSTVGQDFPYWNAMKRSNTDNSTYLRSSFRIDLFLPGLVFQPWEAYETRYKITVDNKGVRLKYEKIRDVFKMIDLSNNKLEGWIPETVGNLTGLHLLNLSNNAFVGSIPPSMGKLINLESLDLSSNKLWGHIPAQLTQLTFLEFLNVSHNNIFGSIPHGKQFDTFQNDSYLGNSGLCGDPLSRKCEIPPNGPDAEEREEDSVNGIEIIWIVMCIGYVGGLVVGLVIGTTISLPESMNGFLHTLGRRLSTHKKAIN